MTDKRITSLTELTSVADNDVFVVVDVSDTTDNAAGTSKYIQKSNLVTLNRERVLGSAFSGSDGATSRTYTLSYTPSGSEIVAVGSAGGALTILDPTNGYGVSGAVLTINGELFDDEVVIVWS